MSDLRVAGEYNIDLAMIDPRMWEAVPKIKVCFEQYGVDCIITCGRNGKHSAQSKHYYGQALDFRTRMLTGGQKAKLFADVEAALGNNFDVVLEKTHLHVEFDQK